MGVRNSPAQLRQYTTARTGKTVRCKGIKDYIIEWVKLTPLLILAFPFFIIAIPLIIWDEINEKYL